MFYRLFRREPWLDSRQLYPKNWKSLSSARRFLALLKSARPCDLGPFRVSYDCNIRGIWGINSSVGNSMVYCFSSTSCSTISCRICSAPEKEGIYWVYEGHLSDEVLGVKIVLSSHRTLNFCLSLSCLRQSFRNLKRNKTSSEISLQQYDTIHFSTWIANPEYVGLRVWIKLSPVHALLAPFYLAEGNSSALDFDRSLFSVSRVATYCFKYRQHVNMAFTATSISNIYFLNCSFYIL